MTQDYITRTIAAYDASPDKYINTTKQMILTHEIETLIDLLPMRSSPVLDAGCAYGRDCAVFNAKEATGKCKKTQPCINLYGNEYM